MNDTMNTEKLAKELTVIIPNFVKGVDMIQMIGSNLFITDVHSFPDDKTFIKAMWYCHLKGVNVQLTPKEQDLPTVKKGIN